VIHDLSKEYMQALSELMQAINQAADKTKKQSDYHTTRQAIIYKLIATIKDNNKC